MCYRSTCVCFCFFYIIYLFIYLSFVLLFLFFRLFHCKSISIWYFILFNLTECLRTRICQNQRQKTGAPSSTVRSWRSSPLPNFPISRRSFLNALVKWVLIEEFLALIRFLFKLVDLVYNIDLFIYFLSKYMYTNSRSGSFTSLIYHMFTYGIYTLYKFCVWIWIKTELR